MLPGRTDTAELGERGVGPDLIVVDTGRDQYFQSGIEPNPERFDESRSCRVGEDLQTVGVNLHFLVDFEPPAAKMTESVRHCVGWAVDGVRG